LRCRAAAGTGDVAVAADDAVDLILRDAGVGHRLLAGEDGVGTDRLVHRHAVPAPVDRRVPVAGYRDLAAVLPDAESVLVPAPLVFVLCHTCAYLFERIRLPAIRGSTAPAPLLQT